MIAIANDLKATLDSQYLLNLEGTFRINKSLG